jgi:membrane protein DedA with SNARE-associated domain
MRRLVKKFGGYNVSSFTVMAVGLALFLLAPLLLWLFDFDSDILGVLIFLVGLLMCLVGLVVRKARRDSRRATPRSTP